jgi:hypothetical protein
VPAALFAHSWRVGLAPCWTRRLSRLWWRIRKALFLPCRAGMVPLKDRIVTWGQVAVEENSKRSILDTCKSDAEIRLCATEEIFGEKSLEIETRQ